VGLQAASRKLAEMVVTCGGATKRSRYEQRRLKKLDHRQLTTVHVYSGWAVVTLAVIDSRLAEFADKRYFIFNKKTSCR